MLRVGVIGPEYADSFAENVATALVDMGHDARLLGSAYPGGRGKALGVAIDLARRAPAVEGRLQAPLVRRAAELRPDLVITVDADLLPETVRGLRATGAKVALWFPDAISNLGRQLMFVAPYDALFFKEPVLVRRARSVLGAPAHYLPEACNPRWHTPPAATDLEPVVVVAGNFYASRVALLERLAKAGVPLRLYGNPLPRWLPAPTLAGLHTGRYIARAEKARVFRSAAAVLNNLSPQEIEGVNCRLFEAAGCGAAVLTDERRELGNLFLLDQEVLAYSDFDELVDRARWLLEHPAEGRRLGDAASKRAHTDHSYQARLEHLVEVVGR